MYHLKGITHKYYHFVILIDFFISYFYFLNVFCSVLILLLLVFIKTDRINSIFNK